MDIACMQKVAATWVGKHDFTSFGASYGYEKEVDPVKTLFCFDVVSRGPYLRMVTEGTGYLYKMVRSLVGTLIEVGRGKLSPEACEALWRQKQRTAAVVTAPAQGLFLDRVWYGR
jgi:tRNA pseudouridine38-40 synthase